MHGKQCGAGARSVVVAIRIVHVSMLLRLDVLVFPVLQQGRRHRAYVTASTISCTPCARSLPASLHDRLLARTWMAMSICSSKSSMLSSSLMSSGVNETMA